MKVQFYKPLVVTSGNCAKCDHPFSRWDTGVAITIVTQKRRRYIGQRFCPECMPTKRSLDRLLKRVSPSERKKRIQKIREAAQRTGMREANLLDYCNRCGYQAEKCRCPGGPYFP